MNTDARLPIRKESEKRSVRRLELPVPLCGKIASWKVDVSELSLRGARVVHHTPFERGRCMTLELSLDGQRIEIECEVVRCRLASTVPAMLYSSGLRFREPSADALQPVRKYLADTVRREVVGPPGPQHNGL